MRYLIIIAVIAVLVFISIKFEKSKIVRPDSKVKSSLPVPSKPKWNAPDTAQLTNSEEDLMIKYGRDLVVNTSFYFGPKGVIAHKSNGMNCQNCHLDAGTRLFGNNFSLVAVSYPKYKDRSASVETVVRKIEDCFQRSLSGSFIDSSSREMKALVAYVNWVGKNVVKDVKPEGAGIEELPFLNRAADTGKGRIIYVTQCEKCHGNNGEGLANSTKTGYVYPPLWGTNSYNIGASIYRISKFAGYVKNNMPFGSTHTAPQLTNENAWDVAAFVNSQWHPLLDVRRDFPKLATKPYDYPYGPYADTLFSINQHKYGPFGPIRDYYAALSKRTLAN